jgi:hypothetical protein
VSHVYRVTQAEECDRNVILNVIQDTRSARWSTSGGAQYLEHKLLCQHQYSMQGCPNPRCAVTDRPQEGRTSTDVALDAT